ncbi:hypothetical protein D3C76_1219940 [compost metagenome]
MEAGHIHAAAPDLQIRKASLHQIMKRRPGRYINFPAGLVKPSQIPPKHALHPLDLIVLQVLVKMGVVRGHNRNFVLLGIMQPVQAKIERRCAMDNVRLELLEGLFDADGVGDG